MPVGSLQTSKRSAVCDPVSHKLPAGCRGWGARGSNAVLCTALASPLAKERDRYT